MNVGKGTNDATKEIVLYLLQRLVRGLLWVCRKARESSSQEIAILNHHIPQREESRTAHECRFDIQDLGKIEKSAGTRLALNIFQIRQCP